MTRIRQDDFITSIADALQYISIYHPLDFIQAMHQAYLREESPAAARTPSPRFGEFAPVRRRQTARSCQDTGIVVGVPSRSAWMSSGMPR